MILKDATYRHTQDNVRLVTAEIYSDGLVLPTSPEDVGLLASDKFDVGSTVIDTKTGNVAMYGEDNTWNKW